jgi:hypothetical protein
MFANLSQLQVSLDLFLKEHWKVLLFLNSSSKSGAGIVPDSPRASQQAYWAVRSHLSSPGFRVWD